MPPAPSAVGNDRFLRWASRIADGYAAVGVRTKTRTVRAVDRTLTVEVIDHVIVAEDAVSISLRARGGAALPTWMPGAHIDVVLPSGRTRQYSLCGDPADRSIYRIVVRRLADGGGGSVELHDEVRPGQALTLRGPRNAFAFAHPRPSAALGSVHFIAGGIGITALLPMVREAAQNDVPWRLVYVSPSRARMALLAEVDDLVRASGGCGTLDIFVGRVPVDVLLSGAGKATSLYVCGPNSMLADVRAAARDRMVAGLHAERFAPQPVVGGRPFNLHLADSDVVVPVDPDTSTLTALRTVRPGAAYSCRQGFCGTCRVTVLEGEVEHRGGSPFNATSNTMLPCVDRAQGAHLTVR